MRRHEIHPDRFLTRIEHNNTACWRVEILRGGEKIVSEYFTDADYGDKELAHTAAVKFRNLVVKKLKIKVKAYTGSSYYDSHVNNWTGMVGVSLAKASPKNKYLRFSWAAKIMKDGRQVNRGWSIRKYGYSAAFKLAAEARAKHTGQEIPDAPAPPEDLVEWAKLNNLILE